MSNSSNSDALLALGAIGLLGLGIAAVLATSDEREVFSARLRSALANRGLSLVKADLGRAASNALVWNVTLRHPIQGVITLIAEFPPTTPAYSVSTADELAARIVAHFTRTPA